MKTTVELPDSLLHRAKFVAAQRRTTLKRLMIQGLEHATREPNDQDIAAISPEGKEFLELDALGVPVLKGSKAQPNSVTNQAIDDLREELGI